ncbi:iron transporter [Desulfolithobacter dissulfuricans]|uniref:Cation-efflux pump FieF n=1 Tax=Desulfolithobacter dissulfuricans TaxID=2795293 RepID=A0A915UBD1_9BACT|nr:cation diffusion facilitator family transporter [Desulfolithobacter dissulfuricans]BCO10580.1 iron transporter [Desulfolithobacter dissulfuricans]
MTPSSPSPDILLRRATRASVAVAVVLIVGKLAAWLLTGSLSVMASLVDSLMDAAASTINLVAVRLSLNPADSEHRFGHGKAEFLAGLAQASFIAGSSFFLLIHAVERMRNPQPLNDARAGIIIMVLAIAITLLLLAYQYRVIRKTNSTAIRADALHYATDILTNAGTILALVLARYGWPGLDPIFAIVIAGFIFYSACKIGYDAAQMLMDRELPAELREKIISIAERPPQVRGVHDVRTRQSGQTIMIQLHLELDDDMPLLRAHGVARAVEKDILRNWPEADVIIHQDPVNISRKLGTTRFTD